MSYRLLLAGSLLFACTDVQAQELPVPDGKRLRQIVEEQYPDGKVFIGGTTGWSKLKRGSGVILDREFSYVTPENDFKQRVIHPKPGKWNWSAADAWIKRSKDNNQVIRIHGPISPQCSPWPMFNTLNCKPLNTSDLKCLKIPSGTTFLQFC